MTGGKESKAETKLSRRLEVGPGQGVGDDGVDPQEGLKSSLKSSVDLMLPGVPGEHGGSDEETETGRDEEAGGKKRKGKGGKRKKVRYIYMYLF